MEAVQKDRESFLRGSARIDREEAEKRVIVRYQGGKRASRAPRVQRRSTASELHLVKHEREREASGAAK